MSILIAALLVAAQASPAGQPAPAAEKKKPQQVCQMMEVTGSRARKRVCRDAAGRLDLGPGVHDDLGERGLNQKQNLLTNQPDGGGGSN